MEDYYVYVYCDPRKNALIKIGEYSFDYLPFYIGYGKKNRLYFHLKLKDTNLSKINKIKSINNDGFSPLIFKLKENMNQRDATTLEKYFITEIGTLIDVLGVKRGPLTNQTPGGDGGPTFFNRILTEEHKDKIRKSNTGKIFTPERLENMSISQKKRDIKIDDNKRKKMLDGMKNMKEESRRNLGNSRGKIWIYNENLKANKRIDSGDLDNFLKSDWSKGFRVFK